MGELVGAFTVRSVRLAKTVRDRIRDIERPHDLEALEHDEGIVL
jgi:hypothetical protein